jgi:kynureninase
MSSSAGKLAVDPQSLYRHPSPLAAHYTDFRVSERLLLTGHSHQAWPDVGLAAQQEAWRDAAEHVDDKWERAFAKADAVRYGFSRLLGHPDGTIALGANTHELVVRFLSALDLRKRPRIVTTDGEFHTLRRQLDRLTEEGIEIVKVPSDPPEAIVERAAESTDDRTAAVMISAVLFQNARIVPGLGELLAACRRVGAELLVDAYHALNVVPFELETLALDDAFVVGGGYKYCQLGEGNCFLRVPPGRDWMRPVITGWFAEFSALEDAGRGALVAYADGPDRWAGATYDPTSHYRAARVFRFFEEHALTPALLREVSQHQVGLLASCFDASDIDPRSIRRETAVDLQNVAGFLALESPHAAAIVRRLRQEGMFADARGTVLRLGPAPYLSDDQLEQAISLVGRTARDFG